MPPVCDHGDQFVIGGGLQCPVCVDRKDADHATVFALLHVVLVVNCQVHVVVIVAAVAGVVVASELQEQHFREAGELPPGHRVRGKLLAWLGLPGLPLRRETWEGVYTPCFFDQN